MGNSERTQTSGAGSSGSTARKVLLTGGAGYIGSTVASALNDAGIQVVLLDSLVEGRPEFIHGQPFYQGDIADPEVLERIFADHPEISVLFHFAALIDVAESMVNPALYYQENLCKAAALLEQVLRRGVQDVVFSSTAAVYRTNSGATGLTEEADVEPLSPYARSKLMFETVLRDLCGQYGARAVALRYFNPVGADPAFRSGPYKPAPSHILGKLTQEAFKPNGQFTVNGNDYATRDGTPLRDYVHVWDLALAHVAALTYLDQLSGTAFEIINVGSGEGVTVREFVDAFLTESGSQLDVHVGPRRAGDNEGAFADTAKAARLLGWTPTLSLRQGVADALRWEERWREQQGGTRPGP